MFLHFFNVTPILIAINFPKYIETYISSIVENWSETL